MKVQSSVLIVDDDRVWGKMVSKALEEEFLVYYTETAKDGISIAKKHHPDVILLDVVMPIMNGYQMCKELKQIDSLYLTPILFITGQCGLTDQLKGFDLGGIDYLVKPIHPKLVQARVKNHVLMSKYRAKLERLTLEDSLTGIGNNRCFKDNLKKEWELAKRTKLPISLLLIDLDYFKNINDKYGHPAGDDCLVFTAEVIQQSIGRSTDIACRIGGDEFACVLTNTNVSGIKTVATRISENLIQKQKIRAEPWIKEITISWGGITQIPDINESLKDFIQKADEGLYKYKKNQRATDRNI